MGKRLRETIFRVTVRNFSFRLGADIANKLFSAVIAVLLANYFGVLENGRYSLVYSFLFISSVLAEFGLPPILMRELAKRDKNRPAGQIRIISNAVALRIVCTIMSFGFAVSVLYFTPSLLNIRGLALLALISLFLNWRGFFGSVFEAQLQLKHPSIIRVGIGLLENILLIALILLKAKIWVFVLTRTLISIPELILYLKVLHPIPFSLRVISRSRINYLIRQSLPLFASTFFIVIYIRIDQIILNAYWGRREVGIYAAAVSISETLWMFANSFMAVMAPMITRFVDHKLRFVRFYHDCFRLLNTIAIPIAVGGTILAEPLFRMLFSDEFSSAHQPFQWLIWGNIFVFWGIVNNKILIVTGRQMLDLLFTSCSLVVNLSLNFTLIPKYGILGAAIATVFAYATGPIMGYFIPATHNYSLKMITTAIRPMISSIIMGLIVYLLRDHFFLALPAGIGVYTLVLSLIGGIRHEDWELVRNLREAS